jgi:hypothetical protein
MSCDAPIMLATCHEQPVPIFQQLATGHPSGRADLRKISAVAPQPRGSIDDRRPCFWVRGRAHQIGARIARERRCNSALFVGFLL